MIGLMPRLVSGYRPPEYVSPKDRHIAKVKADQRTGLLSTFGILHNLENNWVRKAIRRGAVPVTRKVVNGYTLFEVYDTEHDDKVTPCATAYTREFAERLTFLVNAQEKYRRYAE